MHPTFRHTPPMYSRSITQALTLSWPSRIAAGYPPGPAPITTASKRCSAMAALYHAQTAAVIDSRRARGGARDRARVALATHREQVARHGDLRRRRIPVRRRAGARAVHV